MYIFVSKYHILRTTNLNQPFFPIGHDSKSFQKWKWSLFANMQIKIDRGLLISLRQKHSEFRNNQNVGLPKSEIIKGAVFSHEINTVHLPCCKYGDIRIIIFSITFTLIDHIRFLSFLLSFNRSVQSSQYLSIRLKNTLFPFCDFFHHGLYSLVRGALGPKTACKTVETDTFSHPSY